LKNLPKSSKNLGDFKTFSVKCGKFFWKFSKKKRKRSSLDHVSWELKKINHQNSELIFRPSKK
jgi:hypothetical protein